MALHDPTVAVSRQALEVLVGELAGREPALGSATRDALDQARAALAAGYAVIDHAGGTSTVESVTTVRDADHDKTCRWSKRNGEYVCVHGFRDRVHPVGWCDQGCCR
jgi:hypothetical protein